MSIVGYILAVLGILLGLAGDIMILTAVYRRGAILFVTCLLLPFAAWAFALVHYSRLWLPLVLSIGGVARGRTASMEGCRKPGFAGVTPGFKGRFLDLATFGLAVRKPPIPNVRAKSRGKRRGQGRKLALGRDGEGRRFSGTWLWAKPAGK